MAETLISQTIKRNDKDLFLRAQSGDISARNLLFEQNQKICFVIAARYQHNNMEDLLSVAYIGLMKAIANFNVDKNYMFSTYAYKCISNEILFYLRKQNRDQSYVTNSLDEPIGIFIGDTEHPDTLYDILTEEVDFDKQLIIQDRKAVVTQILNYLKTKLKDRDYQIFLNYYGLENHTALKQIEIGQKFNISRSYISRILMASRKYITEYVQDMHISADKIL